MAFAAAKSTLASHHGGGMAKKNDSNVEWFCGKCKGNNGKTITNFGFRDTCRKCNVAKGQCCEGTVKSAVLSVHVGKKGNPPGSKSKDDEIRELKKKVAAEKAKTDAAGEQQQHFPQQQQLQQHCHGATDEDRADEATRKVEGELADIT